MWCTVLSNFGNPEFDVLYLPDKSLFYLTKQKIKMSVSICMSNLTQRVCCPHSGFSPFVCIYCVYEKEIKNLKNIKKEKFKNKIGVFGVVFRTVFENWKISYNKKKFEPVDKLMRKRCMSIHLGRYYFLYDLLRFEDLKLKWMLLLTHIQSSDLYKIDEVIALVQPESFSLVAYICAWGINSLNLHHNHNWQQAMIAANPGVDVTHLFQMTRWKFAQDYERVLWNKGAWLHYYYKTKPEYVDIIGCLMKRQNYRRKQMIFREKLSKMLSDNLWERLGLTLRKVPLDTTVLTSENLISKEGISFYLEQKFPKLYLQRSEVCFRCGKSYLEDKKHVCSKVCIVCADEYIVDETHVCSTFRDIKPFERRGCVEYKSRDNPIINIDEFKVRKNLVSQFKRSVAKLSMKKRSDFLKYLQQGSKLRILREFPDMSERFVEKMILTNSPIELTNFADNFETFIDSPITSGIAIAFEMIRAIMRKDLTSVIALTIAFPYKTKLFALFGNKFEAFIRYLISFVKEPSEQWNIIINEGDGFADESTTYLINEEDKFDAVDGLIGSFKQLLPKFISRSAIYTGFITLFMSVTTGILFNSRAEFNTFLHNYPYLIKVVSGATVAATCAGLYVAVNKGIAAYMKSGKLKDLFVLPGEEGFVEEARNTMYSNAEIDKNMMSRTERMHKVENLVEIGKYMKSPEAVKLTAQLYIFLDSERVYINQAAGRKIPFSVFVTGEPGVGKTVLYKDLYNIMMNIEGISTEDDLTVNVNVFEKHVTRPNANTTGVIINDIPANYDDFSQRDLISYDIFVQQILDSAIFAFRCAAVGDKGISCAPKLLFTTTNDRAFKFPQSVAKVERRLNAGIVAEMWLMKDDGTKMSRDEVEKTPGSEKRRRMRFTLCSARCNDLYRLSINTTYFKKEGDFLSNSLDMDYHQFIAFYRAKYLVHQAEQVIFYADFVKPKAACACGMALANHRDTEGRLRKVFNNCNILDASKEGNTFFEELLKERPEGDPCSQDVRNAFERCFPNDGPPVELSTFKLPENPFRFPSKTELAYLRGMRKFKRLVGCEMDWNDYCIERYDFFMSPEVQNYFALFAVGAVAYILAIIMKKFCNFFCKEDEAHLTTRFDNRQEINVSTMEVANDRSEMRYTPSQEVDWAKKNGFFKVADLVEKKNVNANDLMKLVASQTRVVKVSDGDRSVHQMCIILNNSQILMNAHSIFLDEKNKPTCNILKIDAYDEFSITDEDLNIFSDICIIRHTLPGRFTDLTKFLMKKYVNMQGVGKVYTRGEFVEFNYRPIFRDVDKYKNVFGYEIINPACAKGDCGSPLIVTTLEGSMIAGIQMYKQGDCSGFICVTQESYGKLIEKDFEPVIYNNIILTRLEPLGPLSEKSQLRELPESQHLLVLGSAGTNRKFISSFKHSPWYSTFAPLLSKMYTKPVKVRGMVDGEYKTPLLHALKNINEPAICSAEIMHFSIKQVIGKLKQHSTRNIILSPLTMREALLGCEEFKFPGIPLSTSPGAYWTAQGFKTKRDLFVQNVNGKWDFNENVKKRVEDVLAIYNNGDVPIIQVMGVIKDELRSVEKIEDMNLRIFANCDVEYNIVCAMYLKPLIDFICLNREVFGCYGTINAVSEDWQNLYNRINIFKHKMELDQSKFDARHRAFMLRYVSILIRSIAKFVGYTDKAADIAYFCTISLMKTLWTVDTDSFIKFYGLISGYLLTLVINSLINLIMFVYAFNELQMTNNKNLNLNFYDHIMFAFVGDDSINSVSDEALFFNMKSIEPVFKGLGYTVTAGDKSSIDKPFMLSEITFLKRKFRKHEDLNIIVAPIDKDSIYKSLAWCGKVEITLEQRMAAAAENAQREAFLHGRGFFNDIQTLLKEANEGVGIFIKYFKYEDLIDDYINKNFRVWDA